MAKKRIIYSCPKHPNRALFVEEYHPGFGRPDHRPEKTLGYVILNDTIEEPRLCPDCPGIPYFRRECSEREEVANE